MFSNLTGLGVADTEILLLAYRVDRLNVVGHTHIDQLFARMKLICRSKQKWNFEHTQSSSKEPNICTVKREAAAGEEHERVRNHHYRKPAKLLQSSAIIKHTFAGDQYLKAVKSRSGSFDRRASNTPWSFHPLNPSFQPQFAMASCNPMSHCTMTSIRSLNSRHLHSCFHRVFPFVFNRVLTNPGSKKED
jgi:hypothetical protein